MCAVKIVLAQLEGSSAGRGGSAQGGYNPEACQTIYDHLEEVELRDGDEWLGLLMKKDRSKTYAKRVVCYRSKPL